MKKEKIPQIKKDIKAFLTSEEGRINQKDIARIGLGVLVIGLGLAGIAKPSSTMAGTCNCCAPCPTHCSHSAHSAHSAHSSY